MEERQNEAEKDKAQAVLNLVKTIQEMNGIDLDQLAKYVQLSQMVTPDTKKAELMGDAINQGVTKDVPNVPTQKSIEQNMPSNMPSNMPGTEKEQL